MLLQSFKNLWSLISNFNFVSMRSMISITQDFPPDMNIFAEIKKFFFEILNPNNKFHFLTIIFEQFFHNLPPSQIGIETFGD